MQPVPLDPPSSALSDPLWVYTMPFPFFVKVFFFQRFRDSRDSKVCTPCLPFSLKKCTSSTRPPLHQSSEVTFIQCNTLSFTTTLWRIRLPSFGFFYAQVASPFPGIARYPAVHLLLKITPPCAPRPPTLAFSGLFNFLQAYIYLSAPPSSLPLWFCGW